MKTISLFIFFVTVLLTLIGFGHFVVYKSFLAIFNITNLRLIVWLRGFFLVAALSFILVTLITQMSSTKIGAWLYQGSAIWLGTLYFLFLSSIISFIIFGLNSFLGGQFIISRVIGLILIVLALSVSVYGLINSYHIKVTEYSVVINNLPEIWQNKKILMFSDTHFGNIRNLDFAKKLVIKINQQNPDLVIIAGDYYDGPPTNSKEVAMTLQGIVTKKGIYFAPGNHEDYGNVAEFIQALSSAGVMVLSNEATSVDGLSIVGLDYQTGSNSEALKNILNNLNIKVDQPKILIKHAPTNLKEVEDKGYDLVLSGHTHNGQVWPGPWLARKMFKEFSYGLNYLNQMAVITSSGAGTWGPPHRVGTKSEIVLIHLEKK